MPDNFPEPPPAPSPELIAALMAKDIKANTAELYGAGELGAGNVSGFDRIFTHQTPRMKPTGNLTGFKYSLSIYARKGFDDEPNEQVEPE